MLQMFQMCILLILPFDVLLIFQAVTDLIGFLAGQMEIESDYLRDFGKIDLWSSDQIIQLCSLLQRGCSDS